MVVLVKALNAFCVTRRGDGSAPRPVRWPASNQSMRGGGLPPQHRAFFTPGKQYRAPMFVATTFERHVANDFMQRQAEEPVLWTFRFHAELRCNHVNYIDRNDGTVHNEARPPNCVCYLASTPAPPSPHC